MKSRASYFVLAILDLVLIFLCIVILYTDEQLDRTQNALAEKKTNIILIGKELLEEINKSDRFFYRELYGRMNDSSDSIHLIFNVHKGIAARSSHALLFPSQKISHHDMLVSLTTSALQQEIAQQCLASFSKVLEERINVLSNPNLKEDNISQKIRTSSLKTNAEAQIDHLISVAMREISESQRETQNLNDKIDLIMLYLIIGSVLFFIISIVYISRKLLNPYFQNKEKIDQINQQIWRAVNVIFWEFDLERKVYRGGKPFAQYFGKQLDEFAVTLDEMKAVINPVEWEYMQHVIKNNIESKKTTGVLEFSFVDEFGERRFVKTMSEYQYNDEGALVRQHGVLQDITLLRQAEIDLEFSRERLNDVMLHLEVGMAEVEPIYDENGIIELQFLDMNVAFCNMLNLSYDDVKGKQFFQIFPEVSKGWIRLLAPNFKNEGKTLVKNVFHEKLQKWIHIKVYWEVSNHLVVFVEDITKEHVLKQTLKQNQVRMTLAEQMARLGYFEIDLKKQTVFGNSITYQLHGIVSKGHIRLSELLDVMVSEDHAIFNGVIAKLECAKKAEMVYRVNVGGKIHFIHCVLESTHFGSKRVVAYGFVHDVTNVKLVELELRKAKERAEESDRLKSAFLANMSHEIRTPLSAIVGFSSIILKNNDLSEAERKEYNSLITNNSNALMYLINDIVELSKIEIGEIALLSKTVEINTLLDHVFDVFLNDLEQKQKVHVRLFLNKAQDEDVFLFIDPHRLSQILNNLVSNAIKFTSKGFIEIGYEFNANDEIVFYVKDSGIGIEKESQQLIFEMFRQEDLKIAEKFGGTGLGLAICKKLVELMNGTIWVNSVKGMGATFYFSFPYTSKVKTDEENIKKIDLNASGVPNFKGRTILLADDEEFVHVLFKNYLHDTNATVLSAHDGLEVLKILDDDKKVDVVLLDMRMPRLNGIDTVLKIREKDANIIVIAQTAYAFTGDKEAFLDSGCNDYLAKPVGEAELLQMLNQYLNPA